MDMSIAFDLFASLACGWIASWAMSAFVPEVTGGRKAVVVLMASSLAAWTIGTILAALAEHPAISGFLLLGGGASAVAYGISSTRDAGGRDGY